MIIISHRVRAAAIASCLFVTPLVCRGQFVERRRVFPTPPAGVPAGTGTASPEDELLQSFNFDYSSDAPVARMKIAKYWAKVGPNTFVPFYMFTNFATLIPSDKASVTLVGKELVSQFGGLMNIAFAPSFTLPKAVEGKEGFQGDFRIGGKMVDYKDPTGVNQYAGIGQLGGTLSWYVPFGDKQHDFVQRGLLTLNIRPALELAPSSAYRASFATTGEKLPAATGGFVFDATYNLFEQFVLSAGYSKSTSKLVGGQGFAGVTISRATAP